MPRLELAAILAIFSIALHWIALGPALASGYDVNAFASVQDVDRNDVLNIRQWPSPKSKKIHYIPPDGTDVFVERCNVKPHGSRSDWCRVRYEKVWGWVNSRYLKFLNPNVGRPSPANRPRDSITLNGPIDDEFLLMVKEELARLGKGAHLNIKRSFGASVFTAMKIGRALRRLGVTVEVEGPCASACVILMAGGANRTLRGGVLGVHQPSWAGEELALADKIDHMEILKRYFSDMGVSPAIVRIYMQVPVSEIHWLSPEETRTLGLTNG